MLDGPKAIPRFGREIVVARNIRKGYIRAIACVYGYSVEKRKTLTIKEVVVSFEKNQR